MQCSLFGIFDLPSGSCAQWFSGTFSALAVATALAGYGFNEWRIRREKKERDEENAAGIAVLLRRAFTQIESIKRLLADGFERVTIDGKVWEIDTIMRGVDYELLPPLDKSQIRTLAQYRNTELALEIDNLISNINQTGRSLQGYAGIIDDLVSANADSPKQPGKVHTLTEENSYSAEAYRLAMMCDASRKHLRIETDLCYNQSLQTLRKFNSFVEKINSGIDLRIELVEKLGSAKRDV